MGKGRPRKRSFSGKATNPELAREGLNVLPKILVEDEIPRFLLAAESTADLLAVELMLLSALRVGEFSELKVEDLFLERGELRIRAETAKRSKERRVPVDPRTAALCSSRICERRALAGDFIYPRAEGLITKSVVRTLQRRVLSMAESAEISRFKVTPHTLRHTGITRMLERGIPIESVKEIAGHENLETTMIYTHLSTKHLIRTYREAFGI